MKKLLCFILALGAMTGVAWADIITIPVVSPFTGQLASFGEGVKNGAALKASEINATGGINGHTVKVVLEDDGCDPNEAVTVATKLASDPGVAVVVERCVR